MQSINVQQPLTQKLNTTVRRADSDDAPPSVIHAPDSFKQFVSLNFFVLFCTDCVAWLTWEPEPDEHVWRVV